MISGKMEKAINGQIVKEIYSAYLYMAMSANASRMNLKGIAKWFMVQYHEEMVHAMKFYEYILRHGGKPIVPGIEQPPAEWKKPLDMFEKALDHERFVTKSINELIDLAIEERDHASQTFLHWYVTEQVEEEENANDICTQLRMVADNTSGLFMIDKELLARTLNVPSDFSLGVEAQLSAGGAAA